MNAERGRGWSATAGWVGLLLLVAALALLARPSRPENRVVLGRYSATYATAVAVVGIAGLWWVGALARKRSRWAELATSTFRGACGAGAIALFVYGVCEVLCRVAERPLAALIGGPALARQYPHATLNSRGFRDPERTLAKPPGTWRLVVLGDSFMYGHGVPDDSTCVRHLERALNERGGPRVEVINLSHIGFNSAQERGMLDTLGVRFDPDVVLVAYVLNDPEEHYLTYPTLLPVEWARAMEWSSFYHLLRALSVWAMVAAGKRPDYPEYLHSLFQPGPAWQRHCEALNGIVSDARAAGARVAVVIWPYADRPRPFTPYSFRREQDLAIAAAGRAGAEVLDLYPAFAGERYQDFALSNADSHPNARAQREAAAAIAAFLESRRLLP